MYTVVIHRRAVRYLKKLPQDQQARSLSDLSFNYLIFSKLIFSTILKKQSKSVCC